jgi:hypothetical protein
MSYGGVFFRLPEQASGEHCGKPGAYGKDEVDFPHGHKSF